MLADPGRTPYDLRFRVLGFPVRVHPLFWLFTVLFNGDQLLRPPFGVEFLLAWVAVVFVSILVHELGHALLFRRYGAGSYVVLYAFGGLAIPTRPISGRGRRIMVALAGPGAGFVLCGLVYGSNLALGWGEIQNGLLVRFVYHQLVFVNLSWGLLNLLPVYPLDGGQVSRELCGMRLGGRGLRASLKISFGTALAAVAYSLFFALDMSEMGADLTRHLPYWVPRGTVYTAILFGLLAYTSYQMLQQSGRYDSYADDRVPWER
ncbi:MAG: site-2 protease family protein [Gemmata sp.]